MALTFGDGEGYLVGEVHDLRWDDVVEVGVVYELEHSFGCGDPGLLAEPHGVVEVAVAVREELHGQQVTGIGAVGVKVLAHIQRPRSRFESRVAHNGSSVEPVVFEIVALRNHSYGASQIRWELAADEVDIVGGAVIPAEREGGSARYQDSHGLVSAG